MGEYSDAQIIAAIAAAIREGDIPAVGSLMAMLAVQNPGEADFLRRSILAGLELIKAHPEVSRG